jgi:uncharacterized protein
MTGTPTSSTTVKLLEPTESSHPAFLRISALIGEAFPNMSLLHDGTTDAFGEFSILLLPVDFKLNPDFLSEVYRKWISDGSGTVFIRRDGSVCSRFITFSEQAGVEVPSEIKLLLDGSDNQVLELGTPGSSAHQQFISNINSSTESGNVQRESTLNVQGAEDYIRDRFKKDFPDLAYHNPVHIQDVYDSSLRIAEAEGVTGADLDLLRIGALFHDAGFIHSLVRHEEIGANMAAGVLPAFGFSGEQIAVICQMILATRVPQSPQSLLDQILCDADLDYLGRDDFYPIGNRLFVELQQSGVVSDAHAWNTLQKKFLSAHSYHTEFSRANREPGKRTRLGEIERILG